MTVTVVACCYGDYWRFQGEWAEALENLNTQPDTIIVEDSEPASQYPHAELLNRLLPRVETEWMWNLGVDNQALPDALDGLETDGADALLFGFRRSDGAEYVPPAMSCEEFLAARKNRWPSDSLFRVEAVRKAGGFPLIGHEDWGLWRAMCRLGMVIRPTGRVHWTQRLHAASRTNQDIAQNRALYLEEVVAV